MSTAPQDVIIVIPAFNEAPVIGRVIESVRRSGFNEIILVDDGSSDQTAAIAERSDARVVRHRINRGKGAATNTGITAANLFHPRIIVTMDGDGQHRASEIKQLIEPLADGNVAVSLGTRHQHTSKGTMPAHRRFGHQVANFVSHAYAGIHVTDSQCGFRAFTAEALQTIDIEAEGYDFETEIIRQIRHHNLSFAEVPITAVYTDYSMGKTQKQNITNGLKTLYSLVWKKVSLR